jgi:hypothetical protein
MRACRQLWHRLSSVLLGGVMIRSFVVALLLLVTAGCATKYQEMGFSGGVTAQQVTADTYRIVARGNAYTSGTAIQDFVLLKAAETAVAAGATHFGIIGGADASSAQTINTPGTMQTTVVGRTAFSTYSPGSSTTLIKPRQDVYVRLVRMRAGEAPPSGAISAQEIITFVGSRVQRPS